MTNNSNSDLLFNNWLTKLRTKWGEVPGAVSTRHQTKDLLAMDSEELCEFWLQTKNKDTQKERFSVRGWYHTLYADVLKTKKILDVGSGLGIDAITFAQSGATVTCVDIVESNIAVLKKICAFMNITNISFFLLEELSSLNSLPKDYDVIWCQGSMINVPFEIAKIEAQALLEHLTPGGRWVELAYPKTRWEREGKLPFDQWGDKTDGGAPWIEWYNLEKITQRLSPIAFDTVLSFEFHNKDFNWFDLIRKTS